MKTIQINLGIGRVYQKINLQKTSKGIVKYCKNNKLLLAVGCVALLSLGIGAYFYFKSDALEENIQILRNEITKLKESSIEDIGEIKNANKKLSLELGRLLSQQSKNVQTQVDGSLISKSTLLNKCRMLRPRVWSMDLFNEADIGKCRISPIKSVAGNILGYESNSIRCHIKKNKFSFYCRDYIKEVTGIYKTLQKDDFSSSLQSITTFQ